MISTPSANPAASRASVPGSGTATTALAETAPPVTGDPVNDGSKMNVPPAATVKLVPMETQSSRKHLHRVRRGKGSTVSNQHTVLSAQSIVFGA